MDMFEYSRQEQIKREAPLAYRMSGTFDPDCAAAVTARSIQMVAALWGHC